MQTAAINRIFHHQYNEPVCGAGRARPPRQGGVRRRAGGGAGARGAGAVPGALRHPGAARWLQPGAALHPPPAALRHHAPARAQPPHPPVQARQAAQQRRG